MFIFLFFFFFFQAEDGIRDADVTGVQTCALPICMSGIEVARLIKQEPSFRELPIIMLTARTEEDSKVTGLESGADDYVTKPFSLRELMSRIKAVLRRRSPTLLDQQLVQGDLIMDVISQRVIAYD